MNDTISLQALPAGCGDCLVIEYRSDDGRHRILIDGGLGSTYEHGLGAYLATLDDQPAHFDHVVVSHVDRDHIDGIILALEAGRLATGDIWFNGRDEIVALVNENTRGVRQGDELSALIPENLRNRITSGTAIFVDLDDPATVNLAGNATCTILSPTADRLERLLGKWPEPEYVVSPPDRLLAALEDEEEAATRGAAAFGGDASVANGSSIAFLFEVDDVSLLLTGDAFASDLERAIAGVLEQRGESKLRVDLLKLSHHGSRRNLTDGLLALIEPSAILVCTDGSRFGHPDEDALAKIRENYPDIPVYFTDDTETVRARAGSIGCTPPDTTPLRLHFGVSG